MSNPPTMTFTGFPSEGLGLLAGLAENNTREYFDAHRDVYESALLAPAKAFVVALGDQLRARVSLGLRAEPRINGSILRINRDTRFTTDKRPYKEHLDLWFWEGEGPSREHPGFFIRLRPETVMLGAGLHRLDGRALAAYRGAVAAGDTGRALEEALAAATAMRGVTVGPPPALRRVPRGFDADHARAELLRHDGLYVAGEWKLPRSVSSAGFVGWAAERLERLAPVERWLTAVLDGQRSEAA
jgi:uncharacterized protein (TIGR02453 family)